MVKSISIKGQIWGTDLIFAIVIFIIGIIALYVYAINFYNEASENFEEMFYEGNLASSLILSEGSPENWPSNPEQLEIPGILTSNKINQTKLEAFYNLIDTEDEYKKMKNILGINNEFWFNFTDMEINGATIDGVGKKPTNVKNLFTIERFTIYKNKPVKFVIFIWN